MEHLYVQVPRFIHTSPVRPNKWCLIVLDLSLNFLNGSRCYSMGPLAGNMRVLISFDNFIVANTLVPGDAYKCTHVHTIVDL